MTHLEIPDGVIPWPYLLLGFVATGLIVLWASRQVPRSEAAARVPRVAALAALMVLGQSVPLGFIPFHLNLTVLAGILLGPALGVLAAVTVNTVLAFMGHGGVTVIGLNSLVLITETVLGSLAFTGLRRRLAPGLAAAAAAGVTLLLSLALILGMARLAGAQPWQVIHVEEAGDEHGQTTPEPAAGEPGQSLRTFLAATVPVFLIGAGIESAVTGAVTAYIARVRPDLLARPDLR